MTSDSKEFDMEENPTPYQDSNTDALSKNVASSGNVLSVESKQSGNESEDDNKK